MRVNQERDRTNDPIVSVLMNSYNSESFLLSSVRSILDQTYLFWELVFVDNHSTDASRSIVQDAMKGDSRLRLVVPPYHMPLGEAREFGMQFCSGELVAFLDTDDLWEAHKLELQVRAMQENKECILCYGSSVFINEKGREFRRFSLVPAVGDLFCRNLRCYEVNFQTLLLRRSALESLPTPYFDPSLHFSPDYCLVMSLLAKGPAICLGEGLVRYRVRKGSLSEKTMDRWSRESMYTYLKLKKAGYLAGRCTRRERLQALGRVAAQRAKCKWLRGEREKAKGALKRFRFLDFRMFLAWLVCGLPFGRWIYDWKRQREQR